MKSGLNSVVGCETGLGGTLRNCDDVGQGFIQSLGNLKIRVQPDRKSIARKS